MRARNLLFSALFTLPVLLVSCGDNGAEEAGEEVDQAMDAAEDAAEDVAEEIEEAADGG